MVIHNSGVKTKQQMADEYGICSKTFRRMLLKKNIRLEKGLIFPKDQLEIYDKLGKPDSDSTDLKSPNNSR